MTRLKYFLLGTLAAIGLSAYAGPSILAAIPYGTGCTATANVALSTTSEVVFAAYPGRKEACITNNDSAIAIHVAKHGTATTADPRVPPGGSWCIDINGGYAYEDTIDAIAVSGTPAISAEQCR